MEMNSPAGNQRARHERRTASSAGRSTASMATSKSRAVRSMPMRLRMRPTPSPAFWFRRPSGMAGSRQSTVPPPWHRRAFVLVLTHENAFTQGKGPDPEGASGSERPRGRLLRAAGRSCGCKDI